MRRPGKGRVEVLGVEVDPVSTGDLHGAIHEAVSGGERVTILNVNAHCINLARRDPRLREQLAGADIVFCDGFGVRLAASMLGQRLPQRITYADWLPVLSGFAASNGLSMFFLGAGDGIAQEAAEKLREMHPGLRVVGTHCGFFDQRDNDSVVDAVNAADPDILLVCMGMPLQEVWLGENRHRLLARVCLTGGAAFDYVSGRAKRGPRFLTDNGLEWLARLISDPRRLWRRYLIGNPVFLLRVVLQRVRLRGR